MTPWPWKITEYGNSDEWDEETMALKEDKNKVHRIEGANGEHVCGTCDGCNVIKGTDARMIVAAPELLEAVENLLAMCDLDNPENFVTDIDSDEAKKVSAEWDRKHKTALALVARLKGPL